MFYAVIPSEARDLLVALAEKYQMTTVSPNNPSKPLYGILLLAHGGPNSLDDIEPFLKNIRGGRPFSPHLLDELRDVLGRTNIIRYVSPTAAEELLAALRDIAILVEDLAAERVVPGNPDDDYLVALGLAGRAHVIVSGDTDLLEAGTEPPACSPREFLGRLERLPF